jgi:4-hydroxy-tetrahydrodipicolinate synthase
MEKTFFGVHVPTVTPFTPEGQVDDEGIRALTTFFIDAGVCCLVPTANNGEQPHLTADEKKHIWKKTLDAAGAKITVVPSITGNTTLEVVDFAKYAESIGADGVMMGPPYYFRLNDEELFEHFRTVAEAISIPLMIHNEPAIFKVDVTPGLAARLNQIENIRFIKESTDNTQRVHQIIRLCGDNMTVVVAGGGTALESMLLGAKAWMTGLMNFIPKISVTMCQLAIIEKKFDEARKVYFEKVLPVHSCMQEIAKPVPTVKYALELLGLSVGTCRRPLQPLSESEKARIRNTLRDIGVLKR